ncbi:MAG TPA: 3-hydroxyacyl-CoA dehydrogenase NAD-binding domain-containing protein [Vicinamibacteria bacterium]|nr:3-hydroxyacyl-CoA dehydrogenase NAD-binding domain-containing protein [Vicinamibacteria bacterium]
MDSPVELDRRDGIGFITFDLTGQKVNLLSRAVMERLSQVLTELQARDVQGAIVRSGKDGVFIAGADVNEIWTVQTGEETAEAVRTGQVIMDRIEALDFPIVAAIGGVCLGGGAELALACHGRVGSDHPRFQIGFPEVNLGILPAWGGTTRLPRLIGVRQAMDLILTGRAIDATKAERIGLVDRAVPHSELDRRALELLDELIRGRRPRRPGKSLLLEGNPIGKWFLFWQAKKRVLEKTKGHYPAPLAALDVMRRGASSKARSLELEQEHASRLLPGEVSKSLVRVFLLADRAKRTPDGEPPRVESAGLLGAGTMGGGIARLLASRDVAVRLKDVSPDALGAGLAAARAVFEQRRKRRRLSTWELEKKMALITPSLDWSGFGIADLVIEAIVEDIDIKKSVLRELEAHVSNECLIATNTSTLSVSEMQTVLEHPERMAGFHFFNPVDRMPLIEVVRGKRTDERVLTKLVWMAHRLGKTPVVVNDAPGFVVNRILGPYLNEATKILLESADVEGIDRAFLEFGMPMGPLRLLDDVGIDVAHKAGAVLGKAFGARTQPTGVLEKLVAANRLGKKTGAGFYRYDGKQSVPDPEVCSIIGASSSRPLRADEALKRALGLMIAEAYRCLDEGVVASADELDLAMILGTGFPPFRGGILRYAETYGIDRVAEDLAQWREKEGSRFEPPPSLLERARTA